MTDSLQPTSGQAAGITNPAAALSPNTVREPAKQGLIFPFLGAIFVTVFIISNINATKGVAIGPLFGTNFTLYTDGAFFLFPLAYVVGDVLSECYGYRNTRKIIWTGFCAAIIAVASFYIAIKLPAADFYDNQDAFATVLGLVPRIVAASLAGYLVGQLLNSFTLSWMKKHSGEKRLWARLIGSTIVGEFADTLIFCAIAAGAIGVSTFGEFANYTIVGFIWKTLVEVLVMPITYLVIRMVKRADAEAWIGQRQ